MFQSCIFVHLIFDYFVVFVVLVVFSLVLVVFVVFRVTNAPPMNQNDVHRKELAETYILMYLKSLIDGLKFLMIFHFVVHQSTNNELKWYQNGALGSQKAPKR